MLEGSKVEQVRVSHAVALIMVLSMSSVLSAPTGHIIRVLAIGEVDTAYCPIYGFCASEPSLDVTLAVARDMHGTNYGDKGLQRIIRLYVPRNLESMLSYDFIVINQPVIRFFPQSSLEAMYSAVAEHGVGSLCFMESMYREIYEPWLQTRLSQCYPYDHYRNIRMGAPGGQPYNLEVVMDQKLPPLLRPFVALGIEKIRPFGYARPPFPVREQRSGPTARPTIGPTRASPSFPSFSPGTTERRTRWYGRLPISSTRPSGGPRMERRGFSSISSQGSSG